MSERIFSWLVLFCWVLGTVPGSGETCWTEGIFRQKRHASCPGCRESWPGAIHAPWYGGSFQPESPARELRGLDRGWAKNQPGMLSAEPRGRRSDGGRAGSTGENKCKRENPFNVYEPRAADSYTAVAPSAASYRPGTALRSAYPAEEGRGKGLDLGFRDLFRTRKNQQANVQDGPQGARTTDALNGRSRSPSFQELVAGTFNNELGSGLSRPSNYYAGLVNEGIRESGAPGRKSWSRPAHTTFSFLDLIGRPTTPRFPNGFARSANDPREDPPLFEGARKDQKREDPEYEPQDKVLVVYRADDYPQNDSEEEADQETRETQLPAEFYNGMDKNPPRFPEHQHRGGSSSQGQVFRPSEVVQEPEIRHNPFNLPRDLNILEFVQGIQRHRPFDNGNWQQEVQRLVHDGLTEGARLPQMIEDFEEVVQKREYSPGNSYILEPHSSVPIESNHRIDGFPEDRILERPNTEGSNGGSIAEKPQPPRNATDTNNFPEPRSDVYEDVVENPPEESTEPVPESSSLETNAQR